MSPQLSKSSICKLHIIPILIFLICQGFVLSEFNGGERNSLMVLKEHLDPYYKTVLHSNWTKVHCYKNISHWVGVTCHDGRATQLSLDNMGLNGSIPWSVFANMTELRVLSLKNNSLNGSIPNLSQVYFIQRIDFSYNKLNGHIPFGLVNLLFLKELYLENNVLTGSIPAFNQTSLKAFNVSNNHLTGFVPNTPVLNSFDESAYLGNDLMCGTKLSHNCSSFLFPPLSPSPTPTPDSQPPDIHSPEIPAFHKKGGGLSKKVIISISIVGAAVVLVIIVLLVSLYFKSRG